MLMAEQPIIPTLRITQSVTHLPSCDLDSKGYLRIFGPYDFWSTPPLAAETASFNATYFS